MKNEFIIISIENLEIIQVYSVYLLVQEVAPAENVKRAFNPKKIIIPSKIYSGHHLRCPKYAEFGHLTLLFNREPPRNVPRYKMHVQSYYSAHYSLLFGDVLIHVAVIVCLSFLIILPTMISDKHGYKSREFLH